MIKLSFTSKIFFRRGLEIATFSDSLNFRVAPKQKIAQGVLIGRRRWVAILGKEERQEDHAELSLGGTGSANGPSAPTLEPF